MINWRKKKSLTLKWLGAGPGFLLYLIFLQDMKLFENGVAEGILLSIIFILMPAVAIFVVYWPIVTPEQQSAEFESND